MPGSAVIPPRVARSIRGLIDRASLTGVEDRPIFIGGAPRSGTTLLRMMLHSHPDVAIPRETLFLLEAVKQRTRWGDLRNPVNREALVDWMIEGRKSRFSRLGIDGQLARTRMLAAPPTLGSIVGTAYVLYAERAGATRWGDKRPAYSLRMHVVFALFPDLQFIHLVRDPRAVVASMRRLGWLDSWYDGTVVGGVDRWVRSVRAGWDACRRYRGDQFLELRYEDLVHAPEAQVAEICSYLGLPGNHVNGMLAFHEHADEIPAAKRREFHPLLDQPVTAGAVAAWRQDLAEEEVAFIEVAAARHMRRLGYEPAAEGITVPADLERRWAKLRRRRRRQSLTPRPSLPTRRVAARLTTAQRRRAVLGRVRPDR